MKKKNLLLITLFLLANICFSQVPKVAIKDSIFVLVIDTIIDSAKASGGERRVITIHLKNFVAGEISKQVPDKKFGTVTETRDSLSYRLIVNVDLNKSYFDFDRPDFYSLRRGFLIFVYLGGEKLIFLDKKSKQQVQKLMKSQNNVYAAPKVFYVDVKGDKFQIYNP